MANRQSATAQVANLRDAFAKRKSANRLVPPASFTMAQKQLWDSVIATRAKGEWHDADLPLLEAYVKAWTDIELLHKKIDNEGFVSRDERKANPLLQALNYRFSHMSVLFVRLGLQVKVPVNLADASAKNNAKARVTAASSALDDDEDDGLLARP